MLFKFNYDLLFYGLYISTAVLIGLAFFRFKSVAKAYCMSLNVDPSSNIITVIPNQQIRITPDTTIISPRLEFLLPNEQIQEILDLFGTEISNQLITGVNSDFIIDTYLMPIIYSSNMTSLYLEIFNHFGC
uniref:Uncharacterized protein n=1 Tax=Lactarius deliciosus TaxID=55514 RepID=A0A2Z4M977_9AGAM|nr:hypothetical protein [Lactarius deliciosus]AWX52971.1 hypothetical protein [Lactarius deliciosus]